MVEVFKTNVTEAGDAEMLLRKIHDCFKNYSINFDLDDCDKILRVESTQQLNTNALVELISSLGFRAEILQE